MEMATPPLEARNDNFNNRLYTFLPGYRTLSENGFKTQKAIAIAEQGLVSWLVIEATKLTRSLLPR
jgi:hypothetical protein